MRTVVDARWVGESLGAALERIERKELRKICEPSLKAAAKQMEAAIKRQVPVMSGAMRTAIRTEFWAKRSAVRGYAVMLPRRAVLQKAAERIEGRVQARKLREIAQRLQAEKAGRGRKAKKILAPSKLALSANAQGQRGYYPAYVEFGTKRMKARRFMRDPAARHGRPLVENAARDMSRKLLASVGGRRSRIWGAAK